MSLSKAYGLKNYHWKGIHRSGKKMSGQILALSESEVRDRLKAQHIQPQKIHKRSLSLLTRLTHCVTGKDITSLTRQLSILLLTGVPIIQALKLVGGSYRKAEMKSMLLQISKCLEAGMPISKAMHTSSRHFDSLYRDLIETGEQSGHLAEIFERLANYREKSERLRANIIKALIYPSMVLVVALSVTYLMLTAVIPEFESLFQGFGATLPWFTQQVFNLSHTVQDHGFTFLLLVFGVFLALRTTHQRSDSMQLKLSRLGLKCPIIGSILSKASIAKFSRTLATSFSAGIPILVGLKNTAKTAGNIHFETAIEQVYLATASGMPMYIAMRNTGAFPEMVLQMVMIGEESGKLDDMLNKIANIYEFEVENTVDNLGKILEPLIILLLGVIVGGLVIAMYLPIFNLMSVLG